MPGNRTNSLKNLLAEEKGECLLYRGKIEAKPESARLELVPPSWKAGTLPLSYSRSESRGERI